jgi:anti-sigma-K factor RskA
MAASHRDLALYVLGALEDPREFEEHLSSCERCQAEFEALSDLPALMDDATIEPDVPSGMRERVLGAVLDEPIAEVRRFPTERRRATMAAPRWAAYLAVAALAVVVAGVGFRLSTNDSFSPNRAIELAAPPELGGGATGIARIEDGPNGQVVELDLRGLPPAGEGESYECWFVGPNDTPTHQDRVSAGTFEVTGERTVVRMQAAAAPGRFPNMGITREPEDGNPARTGPKVLVTGKKKDL